MSNDKRIKSQRGRPPYPDQLTPAEWRVVHAVRHGLTNSAIASRLGISINAVKYHIANAVEKTGVSNKRGLVTWLGTPNDSAANNEEDFMNTQQLGLGQIARTVKNAKQSEQWYRQVLGLAHLYTFGTMVFFDCDGVRLMLNESEEPNDKESIIYFKTQDIRSHYEQLQEQGIEFSHAPHKIHQHQDGTEEWMAFFNDLEGRPLGLSCIYR